MTEPAAHHLVCGSRPWNRATFDRIAAEGPGTWAFASTPEELAGAVAAAPTPTMVFFLHWSWIVPATIHEAVPCVVFHMTDVPYGRGGSPLQNLILAGHRDSMLSAIAMTDELDAGPVYAKAPLSLTGTAEEIYRRADALAAELIVQLATELPEPVPQEGEPVVFARRTPEQSAVPADLRDLDAWFDFVRMLDADGYPHAHLDHGPYRITLRGAERLDGRVRAEATIQLREDPR